MNTPHTQMRLYIDSTFSVDFYEEFSDAHYIEKMLEGISSVKRMVEIKLGQGELRSTPFYFIRCENCGFYILTNRDQGYKLDCQNCQHRNYTCAVDEPELKGLLEEIHRSLGKSFVNLKGQTIIFVLQPNDPDNTERIDEICKGAGFEPVALNTPSVATVLSEALERKLLNFDRTLLSYQMIFQKDLAVYANDTPPIINELLHEIRILDPGVISASIFFDAGVENLTTLFMEGRFAEAEQRAREQVRARPHDSDIRLTLSIMLKLQGKLDEAKEQILVAQEMSPENPMILAHLGAVERQFGNYSEAISALKHAVAIDPLDTSAMRELSFCYRKIGRLDLASEIDTKLHVLGGPF